MVLLLWLRHLLVTLLTAIVILQDKTLFCTCVDNFKQNGVFWRHCACVDNFKQNALETSLICILLSASRDVHFDKRMICFLSGLL